MKAIFIGLLLVLGIETFGQTHFKKGYFIDDTDTKTECFIKDVDWYSHPTSFLYKLTEDGAVKDVGIETIKGFGIGEAIKYIREEVKVDYSSNNINELSVVKNPEFEDATLFLRVLVEGDASLYMYRLGSLVRFFYSLGDSPIEQLVYKQYIVDPDGLKYAHNDYYKQQLYLTLKCDALSESVFESLNYIRKDLERLFKKYNSCNGYQFKVYEAKKRVQAHFAIRPGVNISSFKTTNPAFRQLAADFGTQMVYRVGGELEIVLPFNNSKWNFIFEPSYEYFKAEVMSDLSDNEYTHSYICNVDYKTLVLPVGVRYYMFVNDDFKLFANMSLNGVFPINSSFSQKREDTGSLYYSDISSWGTRLALGMGIKYKDRYAFEIRQHVKGDALKGIALWVGDYTTTSFILSYSLF